MNGDLPEGWAAARVGDVTEHVPNAKPEEEPQREFGYIDISAIDNSNFTITDVRRFQGSEAPSRARRPIQPKDVLFSNVRTYLRNVALVRPDCTASLCSTGFTVLRPNGAVEPQYLFRYVLTDDFTDRVTPQQTGTHYPATSDRVVMAERILLAPLAEQRRVVAQVEALLDKVRSSQERIDKIPAIIKRFRQSVLAAACSGRLTADWREEHPDAEPYPVAIELPDEAQVLPPNWKTTRLGELTALVTSGSRGWAKYYAPSGSTFIRAQNINSDSLNLDGVEFVQPPTNAEGLRTRVRQHDILITITGANVTKAALIQMPIGDAYVSQHVALVRLKDCRLGEFLFHCIVSPAHGRNQLLAAAYGQGKPGLNLDNVRSVVLDLPPLLEQQEIVRRVKSLFGLADRLQVRYKHAKAHVDRLTQSVLAKAFRGELVPTEAELARREGRQYETAGQLLERIQAKKGEGARQQARRTKRLAATKG